MLGQEAKILVTKPRKPIRKVSKKKAASDKLYRARVKVWLEGKVCAVYPWKDATQCHHQRGRAGSLKMDERFWIPVSTLGHDMIRNHPNQARIINVKVDDRNLSLLCQIGEWNKPVK